MLESGRENIKKRCLKRTRDLIKINLKDMCFPRNLKMEIFGEGVGRERILIFKNRVRIYDPPKVIINIK